MNETVSVPEDVGVVTIYVGFIEPDEISEDIIANILFFTEDISATGSYSFSMNSMTQCICCIHPALH